MVFLIPVSRTEVQRSITDSSGLRVSLLSTNNLVPDPLVSLISVSFNMDSVWNFLFIPIVPFQSLLLVESVFYLEVSLVLPHSDVPFKSLSEGRARK